MAPRKMNKSTSKTAVATPAVGPAPPGGPIEIVFSFDTTGSMSGCIAEVRLKVQEIIQRLFSDIPGLRIAVFAHGDYCDSHNYVTKWVDFSNDQKVLCDFVKNVSGTGGGDYEECYELVLRQVRENLTWTDGTQRSLVMIGDAIPHPKNDSQNKLKIDWKEEVQKLHSDMGVRIYSVQCSSHTRAEEFWQHMANSTGGKRVQLQQFNSIIDMIMSICYRETGADWFMAYEKEVRAREGDKMRSELNLMFDALREASPGTSRAPASKDVSPGTCMTPAKKTPSLKRTSTLPVGDLIGADLKKAKGGKVTKAKKRTPAKLTLNKKSSSVKAAAKLVAAATKRKRVPVRKATAKDEKIPREDVPTTRFLPQLPWSNWYPAYQSDKPTTAEDSWSDRKSKKHSRIGVRHHDLFYHDTLTPAVYEMAVQPKPGSRKCPVWSTVTKGFNSVYWDTYLVRSGRIKNQLDDILKNNRDSKVFVRRAELQSPVMISIAGGKAGRKSTRKETVNSVDELRCLIRDVYDYAWIVNGKKTSQRKVRKDGVAVSKAVI